jgi:predicted nucleic acid-binding protein
VTTDLSSPHYIVDTSVVLKWFVQSDESDCSQARELRTAYVQKHCTLSCPEFLALELANDLVLETLRWSTLARAVELAASLNTAVYDSYFLASAIESGSTLVTADDLFVRKVGKHPNLSALRQLRIPE